MRRLRTCVGFAAAAALGLVLPWVASSAPAVLSPISPAAASTGSAQSAASIELTKVTPWLDADGTLRVEGTITANADIDSPQLTLSMSSAAFDSTTQVADWKEESSAYRTIAEGSDLTDPLPGSMKEGSTAPFAFSLEPKDIGLSASDALGSWGARGLRIDMDGSSDYVSVADPAVTFTTWYPDPGIEKSSIGTIVPVTYTGFSHSGLLSADELEAMVTDGTLRNVLDALTANPDSVAAIDPRILASVEAAAGTEAFNAPVGGDGSKDAQAGQGQLDSAQPTEHSGDGASAVSDEQDGAESQASPSPALQSWWEDFTAEAQKHTIIALPWADADLTALRAQDMGTQADFAQDQRTIVQRVFPEALTDWAWPAQGQPTSATLAKLHSDGYANVILADAQLPSARGHSVNSKTQLSFSGSDETIVTPILQSADTSTAGDTLSGLVTDTALTQAVENLNLNDDASAAASESELVALTAAITSERPFDPRTLALSFPRTNATAEWSAANELLSSVPWLETASLKDIQKSQLGERSDFIDGEASKTLAANLDGIEDSAAKLDDFASIFSDPDSAREAGSREVLTCTSVEFGRSAAGIPSGTQGQSINDCRSQLSDDARAIIGGVSVEKGSNVLLVTGEDTTIPVTISNSTDREVTVEARLVSDTPQLQSQSSEPVTIPAGQQARVSIPVRGLANADVSTHVTLVAADGSSLANTSNLTVSVRADWENIGTAVVGGSLAVVFVVGLAFSIRRGRRKIPQSQLDAALARVKE